MAAVLLAAGILLHWAVAVPAAEPLSVQQSVPEGDVAARDTTLVSARNGFALTKLGTGLRRQQQPRGDRDLAGLQSPGAFRAVRVAAMTDPGVVQTSGEFPISSPKTAMLPLPPPSALHGEQGVTPLPRPDLNSVAQPRAGSASDVSPDLNSADKCNSARSLKSISNITADIAIKPADLSGKRRLPPECELGDEPVEPRKWQRTIFTWTAAATYHKPIYFDDDQMERYGHTFGPVAQTTLSAVKFFSTVPLVPYYMGVYPPRECIYDLGTYRPGSCATVLLRPLPVEHPWGSQRDVFGDTAGAVTTKRCESVSHRAHSPATLPHAAAGRAAGKLVCRAGRMHAGTLNDFVKCFLPHAGQTGFSSPRISNSKSLPQSLQVYS